jgi:hypothetical protein
VRRCVTAEITARAREIGTQSLLTILLLTPTAIVLAGSMRKSKTMNPLPADHPPSNSNGVIATPVVNDLRNPLWIIAIGMACFFGTAVVVIALSWS